MCGYLAQTESIVMYYYRAFLLGSLLLTLVSGGVRGRSAERIMVLSGL